MLIDFFFHVIILIFYSISGQLWQLVRGWLSQNVLLLQLMPHMVWRSLKGHCNYNPKCFLFMCCFWQLNYIHFQISANRDEKLRSINKFLGVLLLRIYIALYSVYQIKVENIFFILWRSITTWQCLVFP